MIAHFDQQRGGRPQVVEEPRPVGRMTHAQSVPPYQQRRFPSHPGISTMPGAPGLGMKTTGAAQVSVPAKSTLIPTAHIQAPLFEVYAVRLILRASGGSPAEMDRVSRYLTPVHER